MRAALTVLAAMVLTGGALAPGASARNASRSDTLIGRWVSNSNAAVAPPPLGLFGGARLVRTGSGSALSLNGVGGFARIADRPALDIPPDGAFTLDARVNTLDTGRYQAVVVKATPGGSWSWGSF